MHENKRIMNRNHSYSIFLEFELDIESTLPKIIDINKDELVFTKVKAVRFNEDFVSKQFKNLLELPD